MCRGVAWVSGARAFGGTSQAGNDARYARKNLVDVRDYGTVGDGAADDTAAIQAAIQASTVGATIFFPAGTYLVSAPIVMLPGRTYRGDGPALNGASTIKQKSGANITNGAGLTGLLVAQAWSANATGCDAPVRVENLAIDGNKAANSSSTACGIVLTNFWSCIESCYVSNIPKHGIHLTDTTANGTNVITNSASENRIQHCKVSHVGGHGISQVCANNISNQDGFCVDNLIDTVGLDGINFQRGSGWVFRRNHLYGITGYGFNLSACFATAITDNEVEDFGLANVASTYYVGIAVVQLDGRGTTITGNFIGCTEPAGTAHFQYLSLTAGSGQTDAQAIVTDNLFHGPQAGATANGEAIIVQHASGGVMTATVAGNRVANINTPYYVAAGDIALMTTIGQHTIEGLLQFKAHESSSGNPTAVVTAGAQATSASSVGGTGNDAAGQVTATTVGSPAAGAIAVVTFGTTYGQTPRAVNISPASAAAAAAQLYVSAMSATAFTVSCAATPAATTALVFNYRVTG
jgi:hypothetical protein